MSSMKKQTGSVLIISLLLLIVTTLLGLSSMNNTIMEEKMAGNLRQQNLALQSAESALREAEAWLAGLGATKPDVDDDGSTTVWVKDSPEGNGSGVPSSPTGLWWTNDAVWTSQAINYTNPAGVAELNNTEYLIEDLDFEATTLNRGLGTDLEGYDLFQITARGFGVDGRSQVMLRTTAKRKFE